MALSQFKRQAFDPDCRGLLFNPLYLIRRYIAKAIKENASHLNGGVIIDYGCGSKPYESFFQCDQYIGVDVETSGHPASGKKADVFFDNGRMPFDDAFADGVLASEVLEHVFDLRGCLRDIHRVLKPGGKLLATCPFVWPLHEEPYDYARYTPYALERELQSAGFKIIKLEQKGRPIEVLGQMWIVEILPALLPPIPKISRVLSMLISGAVILCCRLLASFGKSKSKLYLSNVILAEKPVVDT